MTEPAGWQQYAALLRELDRLRLEHERSERARAERAEAERLEAGRAGPPAGGVAALRAELVRVEAALDDQADQLDRLARLLKVRLPGLSAAPAPRTGSTGATKGAATGTAKDGPADGPADAAPAAPAADPFVLLEQAVGHAQRSADLANQAERQARRPRLLPALATGPRNLLVYLVAALLGLAVQYPIVNADPQDAPFAVVLVLVPAVTFGLGWLVITLFGRSRLVSAAERARVGVVAGPDPRRRSVRLGLTVCFLAFPALFAVLLVTGRLSR